MTWTAAWLCALLVFFVGLGLCISRSTALGQGPRWLSRMNVLMATVFLTSVLLFLPIYACVFRGEEQQGLKTLLLSVHNTIRLFVVDGEFSIVTDYISPADGWIYTPYSVFFAILFLLAPLLTFGFVLSFFKNLSAYRRYLAGYFKTAYIFSDLNERSLALAQSLRQNDRRRMILFANVFDEEGEACAARRETALALGAICFRKDMASIRFGAHSRKKELYFFAISDNESDNVDLAMELLERLQNRPGTNLYVFSTRIDSELLLAACPKGAVRLRRVNEIQSLIQRLLYEEGHRLFEEAAPMPGGGRQLSALLLGLGQYGRAMLKSLSWFGQMEGYRLEIDAFDADPLAGDKLAAECPELLDERFNGAEREGEAQYHIRIHAGLDADTKTFADALEELSPTYILVAAGSDEENIRLALGLRMLFARRGLYPRIQSIVHNSRGREALAQLRNYRGQRYDIDFIGGLEQSFSEEVILNSALEAEALAVHCRWGEEEDFWAYEYNYRSSVASAIHTRAKIGCGIPGAGQPEDSLRPAEAELLARLEHRRWNAYMRSEGYIYSGSQDKSSRNDLAKMHHDLVDYALLAPEERQKDLRVTTQNITPAAEE